MKVGVTGKEGERYMKTSLICKHVHNFIFIDL